MMKKLLNKLIVFALLAFLVTGCVEKVDENTTPKYVSVGDDFKVISDDTLSVTTHTNGRFNFVSADSKGAFSSEFNMVATWTIRVTGQESGAVKELKGTTSKIDPLDVYWSGDSDGLPFFRKGEAVVIELDILGLGVIKTLDPIDLFNVPSYTENYILVSDFDGNPFQVGGVSNDFYPYYDNDKTEGNSFDDDQDLIIGLSDRTNNSLYSSLEVVPSPIIDALSPTDQILQSMQGVGYLHVSGIDGNGVSTFFVGGARQANSDYLKILKNKGWVTELTSESTAADTAQYEEDLEYLLENMYLNVYINGNGNRTTRVDLELREIISADDFNAMHEGEAGYIPVVDDVEQDKLTRSVDITWNGWRLISIKLSSMTWHPQENAGNRVWEWEKFKSVAVGVLAGNEGAQGDAVDANFDFITLSLDAPFDQKID